MAKTARRRDPGDNVSRLLDAVGGCAPPDVQNVLDLAIKFGDETALAAACAALCAIDPQGRKNAVFGAALDTLCKCQHPLAASFLAHIAKRAKNARIKLEATRRLGRAGVDADGRSLLHELARGGFGPTTFFTNDVITSDMFRKAAVEALGDLTTTEKADRETLLAVLSTELEKNQESDVLITVADSLSRSCKAGDLQGLLSLAEKPMNERIRLRLLTVCSALPKTYLGKRCEALGELLCNALREFDNVAELEKPLRILAAKIAHEQLAVLLSQRYHSDQLHRGRGSISAVVLENCEPSAELATAYLGFAKTLKNVSADSHCIKGLQHCAGAGHVNAIMRPLFRDSNPGYDRFRRSAFLLFVIGSVRALVEALCNVVQTEQSQQRRADVAWKCHECILSVSVSDPQGSVSRQQLQQITPDGRQLQRGRQQGMSTLAESLTKTSPDRDAIGALTHLIVTDQASEGAVAIAGAFFEREDELAEVFLERLLTTAGSIALDRPDSLPPTSAQAKVEAFFPKYRPWLREHLSDLVMVDNTLNRYVLDLLRRQGPSIAGTAETALRQVCTAEDAGFILESLRWDNTPKALQCLGRACGFVSDRVAAAPEVRAKAVSLVGKALCAEPVLADSALTDELLDRIHARFQEDLAVRSEAYHACARVASPQSILPLIGRLASDSSEDAKTAISQALAAIGRGLKEHRPASQDANGLICWLEHVANLGDASFLPEVLANLSPPHSDQTVLVATLQCVEKLGDRSAVAAIEQFAIVVSPTGELLGAVRHATAVLLGRNDLELVELLSQIFDPESPVLDPNVDYESLFGAPRMTRLVPGLRNMLAQRPPRHWDDLVTRLDGVCDILVRHLFEKYWSVIGLDEHRAQAMAGQDYGNRLRISEFQNSFTTAQPLLSCIHSLRYEATTAHGEDADGTEKPGLTEQDAILALDQFRKAFVSIVTAMRTANGSSPENTQ